MRLKGKRAFISGAGGGIGAATALKFAREGARLALADIRCEPVEAIAARIACAGGEAIALAGDIAEADSCRALIEESAAKLGGLDILFNNAGIALDKDNGPVDTPLDAWE